MDLSNPCSKQVLNKYNYNLEPYILQISLDKDKTRRRKDDKCPVLWGNNECQPCE